MSCLQILERVPFSHCTAGLQSFLETHAYTASSSWTDKVSQKTPAKKHLQLYYTPDTNKKCPKIKGCVLSGPWAHPEVSIALTSHTTITPQSLAYYRTFLCTSAKYCSHQFHKSSCFITGQVRKKQATETAFLIRKMFICNNKHKFNFWMILQHPVKATCGIPSSTNSLKRWLTNCISPFLLSLFVHYITNIICLHSMSSYFLTVAQESLCLLKFFHNTRILSPLSSLEALLQ